MDKFYSVVAYYLPKNLVKWAFLRVVCYATTGEYSNQIVPELTAMDALSRWIKN